MRLLDVKWCVDLVIIKSIVRRRDYSPILRHEGIIQRPEGRE